MVPSMMGHDFIEAPGHKMDIGDNPHEVVMMLRCKWCNYTPSKSRADGCPMHELAIVGHVRLDAWNPDGIERFAGRKCVTCDAPIMEHWIRNDGTLNYFCTEHGCQTSDGITDCTWNVPEQVYTRTSEQLSKDIGVKQADK